MKRIFAFLLAVLLCLMCFSGCSGKKEITNSAVQRWKKAIQTGNVTEIARDYLLVDESGNRVTITEAGLQWLTQETAAFDGTPLEPYVERARKSMSVNITFRMDEKTEDGLWGEYVKLDVKGDALSGAIVDWLTFVYEHLPEDVQQNTQNLDWNAYALILHDTMNHIDSIYGQTGTALFSEFDRFYEQYENYFDEEVSLLIIKDGKNILYCDFGGFHLLSEMSCGSIHYGLSSDAVLKDTILNGEEYGGAQSIGYAYITDSDSILLTEADGTMPFEMGSSNNDTDLGIDDRPTSESSLGQGLDMESALDSNYPDVDYSALPDVILNYEENMDFVREMHTSLIGTWGNEDMTFDISYDRYDVNPYVVIDVDFQLGMIKLAITRANGRIDERWIESKANTLDIFTGDDNGKGLDEYRVALLERIQ